MTRWRAIAALILLAGAFWALAEPEPPSLAQPVDVARLMPKTDLARTVLLLEDAGQGAKLADVRGPLAAKFARSQGREIGHGFSASALWMRLDLRNTSASPVRWFFEVAEPTLDDLQLSLVHADGRIDTRTTGDDHPFASRDVESSTFVFELTLPAQDTATLYVRVASTGALRIPVAAWQPEAFARHHQRSLIAFWLLFGAMAAVSLYYAVVFLTTKQQEFLWCSVLVGAMMLAQMSLDGGTAVYFLPDHPLLVNRLLPASIALAMVGIACFVRESLGRVEGLPDLVVKVIAWSVKLARIVLLFALLAPMRLGMAVLCGLMLAVCAAAPLLVRAIDMRKFPELRLYVLCWWALMLTVPLTVLRYLGVLPPHPLLEVALRAGTLGTAAVMAVALASWVTAMRAKLSAVNAALSDNVSNLKTALARAEEASARAERATMAKDEFMATMSHELRTPLNAIINIPQGMIGDFETVPTAHCSACGEDYLLEENEHVGPAVVCQECERRGTLVAGVKVVFKGDPARSLRFLEKIERSGKHLLQMVNGVLDYTKMEAGHFQLVLEPANLEALCREVVDQMSDLGSARSIQLVFTRLSETPDMTFDPLRIKQVLINLLSNAVKFSEPNSVVGIELRRDGDAAVIEVQDAGIGIAKENHERIFAGFEQVHKGDTRKYGGTGLGLSISRSLVRMHGGELSVRSEIGSGATFVVRLPRLPNLASQLGTSELKAFTRAAEPTTQRQRLG